MFNIQEIQDCLFDLVGWKNSLNTCEIPLDPLLYTSETGQYYNNTHALLRLDNLQAIAPSKMIIIIQLMMEQQVMIQIIL